MKIAAKITSSTLTLAIFRVSDRPCPAGATVPDPNLHLDHLTKSAPKLAEALFGRVVPSLKQLGYSDFIQGNQKVMLADLEAVASSGTNNRTDSWIAQESMGPATTTTAAHPDMTRLRNVRPCR